MKKPFLIITSLFLALAMLAQYVPTGPVVSQISQLQVRVSPFSAVTGTSFVEYTGGNYTLPNNYVGYLVYKVSDGTITNTTTMGTSGFIYLYRFVTRNNNVVLLHQPLGIPKRFSGDTLLAPYTSGGTNSTPTIEGPTFYDDILLPEFGGGKLLTVESGVLTELTTTTTDTGTTGSIEINAPAGRVNFAAAATSLVVTNSYVATNSVVIVTINTDDDTAVIKSAVPDDGLLTINLTAGATAETAASFFILNP